MKAAVIEQLSSGKQYIAKDLLSSHVTPMLSQMGKGTVGAYTEFGRKEFEDAEGQPLTGVLFQKKLQEMYKKKEKQERMNRGEEDADDDLEDVHREMESLEIQFQQNFRQGADGQKETVPQKGGMGIAGITAGGKKSTFGAKSQSVKPTENNVYREPTKAQKLKKKIESVMEEMGDKPTREIDPTIRKIKKSDVDYLLKTVARNNTVMNIKRQKELEGKVENKYRPSYKQIDCEAKLVPKWKQNNNEHSFFYTHNEEFRHKVDLDIGQETSDKRMTALKKLYFEYKNKATFRKATQLNQVTSVPSKASLSIHQSMSSMANRIRGSIETFEHRIQDNHSGNRHTQFSSIQQASHNQFNTASNDSLIEKTYLEQHMHDQRQEYQIENIEIKPNESNYDQYKKSAYNQSQFNSTNMSKNRDLDYEASPVKQHMTNLPSAMRKKDLKSMKRDKNGPFQKRFQSQIYIKGTNQDDSQASIQHGGRTSVYDSYNKSITQDSSPGRFHIQTKPTQELSSVDQDGPTAVDTGALRSQESQMSMKKKKMEQKRNRANNSVLPKLNKRLNDDQDSIISSSDGEGAKDSQNPDKKKNKRGKQAVPLWRDPKQSEQVSKDDLERFATQLNYRQTLLHIQNEDTANTLNDTTIQHHKQLSRHVSVWLENPVHIGENAHESRFLSKPDRGLPEIHSKVRRMESPVKMRTEISRADPIIDLTTNELVQVAPSYNQESFYNYDLEKATHNPLAKQLTFNKEKRFTNNGIFGDLYDPKKGLRFGSEGGSILNIDKAVTATIMLRPRMTEQKSFDKYVSTNCSVLEAETGSKDISQILNAHEERLQSVTSLKVYKRLVNEKKSLPVLEKVNHLDYLPNSIKKRQPVQA